MTITRKQLVEEALLRKSIRKILGKIKENKTSVNEQEQVLRKFVKKMIAQEGINQGMIDSTGIAKLDVALESVVDTVKDEYRRLKSSVEERQSFRDNLLHEIENLLQELDLEMQTGEASTVNEEINLSVAPGETEYLYTDPADEEVPSKEKEKRQKDRDDLKGFGLEDSEETGRINAHHIFKNQSVAQNIETQYNLVPSKKDRELFKKWLMINLNFHMDQVEEELTGQKAKVPDLPAGTQLSPDAPESAKQAVAGGAPEAGLGLPEEEDEVIPPPSFE